MVLSFIRRIGKNGALLLPPEVLEHMNIQKGSYVGIAVHKGNEALQIGSDVQPPCVGRQVTKESKVFLPKELRRVVGITEGLQVKMFLNPGSRNIFITPEQSAKE